MHRHRRSSILLLLVAVVLLAPAASRANPFFPLEHGTRWVYQRDTGGEHHWVVSGTVLFQGVVSTLVDDSPCCDGTTVNVRMRLVEAADGSVYYTGHGTDPSAFYTALDPPRLYIPGELSVGIEWSSNSVENRYNGNEFLDSTQYEYVNRVTALETVTVPLGSFEAYRVETTAVASGSLSIQWFAENVGVVRSEVLSTGRVRELSRLEHSIVATQSVRWGQLKDDFEGP